MIPKIIHFVWSGPHPMPSYAETYIDAWRQSHPGYDVRVWTDANRPALEDDLLWAYDNARNFGESSDVVRHSILREFGGWSIDLDILPVAGKVNALDALYVEMGRWYDEMGAYSDGLVLDDGSRVVGSAAGGAMICEVCASLVPVIRHAQEFHPGLRAAFTGFALIQQALKSPRPSLNTCVVAGTYFPAEAERGAHSIGIHAWEGHWLKQLA